MSTNTSPFLHIGDRFAEKLPNGTLVLTKRQMQCAPYDPDCEDVPMGDAPKLAIRQEDVPALRDWINEQWPKEV